MKMSVLEKQFVNSPSHSRQVSSYAESLLQYIEFTAGQKYLDVGCGNGTAAIHLAQTYHLNVTGIDVDPKQIQLAQVSSKHTANTQFFTMDSTHLPFDNGAFDIVFTNKVTHHIPNWQDALAEMLRVLKPGGYFIYSDFVVPDWVATIGQPLAGKHLGLPTVTRLNALVAAQNLNEVHRKKTPIIFEAIFQRDNVETLHATSLLHP